MNPPRRWPALVVAALILTAAMPALSSEDMQIRVYLDNKEDYLKFTSQQPDVVWRGDGWFEIIGADEDLDELQRQGLRTEVIHPDLKALYKSRLVDKDMGGYLTLAEIWDSVDVIIADHPDIVSGRQFIGSSHEGRSMYAVKISDNPTQDEPEPEVMYTAAIHAREVITPLVLLNVMNYLTDNYGVLPEVTELVDERELWFVPMVNPDGYYHNQVTDPNGGGLWRKNRRDNGDGTYGVDLNRNFGYEWGYDDGGSSPNTGDATYRGPSAFSEPETQNMRAFTQAHHFVNTVYLHSYSNLVLWPWGYDYLLTPDEPLFRIMGDSMSAYNGYAPGPAHSLYPANGVSDDWGYGEQVMKNKNLAFTFEIGGYADGFWPDPSRIPALVAENLQPCLFLARVADNPYKLLPPNAPVATIDDTVDASSYEVEWTHDDPVNPAEYFALQELSGWGRTTDSADNFSSWNSNGFSISTSYYVSSPSSFYSGSGNNLANTMTTSSPVSVQAGDTLRVWVVYDIETNWDYAYVEASTDGSTFTPIEGSITTNYDPHGNNRGNGITGEQDTWIEAAFDLSPWVGQSVYFRLSYYTDSYVDYDGIWFDDFYPIENFELVSMVNDSIVGSRHTFTNHMEGEFSYRVRAYDAETQAGAWSNIVSTVVIDSGYTCVDSDGDGFGDPGHPENDCADDNCPEVYNPDQTDSDGDGLGDACDDCPNDPDNDIDADGICGDIDNCPEVYNPDQAVSGGLPMGDACCCQMRGDVNRSDEIDIEDLVYLVNFMFSQGDASPCPAESDINGDGAEGDIADLIHLVSYMFQSGPPPVDCL